MEGRQREGGRAPVQQLELDVPDVPEHAHPVGDPERGDQIEDALEARRVPPRERERHVVDLARDLRKGRDEPLGILLVLVVGREEDIAPVDAEAPAELFPGRGDVFRRTKAAVVDAVVDGDDA